MKIELLADHQSFIPQLAEWYLAEWGPYYGEGGPGDAQIDLSSRCNRDGLPLGVVAIDGEQLLGVAALDLDVTTNLTPSVVGLLVGPDFRQRGVATALIKACEEHVQQLDEPRLYVSTSVLGDLLKRLGWQAMGEVEFLNAEHGSVFVRILD